MPEGNRSDPVPLPAWRTNIGRRFLDPIALLLAGVAVASFVIDQRSTAVVVGALAVLNVLVVPATRPRSTLDRQLRSLGAGVGIVAGGTVAFVIVLGLARGLEPRELVLVGTAMAIAAIPVGLSACVHGVLSGGARQLAESNAAVTSLDDVVTLGTATAIVSRTTGILTLDQLTVRKLWYQGQWFGIEGSGYSKNGAILRTVGQPTPDFQALVTALTLAGDATVSDEGEVAGDRVEAALVVLAAKLGFDAEESRRAVPRLVDVPVVADDAVTATLHQHCDGRVVEVVTGDADIVLACSSKLAVGANEGEPVDRHRSAVQDAIERLSGEGLRVVALADRHFDEAPGNTPDATSQVGELRLIALVGIVDPVRPTSKAAVVAAQLAGIDVRLITDACASTGGAVGAELGLGPGAIGGDEHDADWLEQADLSMAVGNGSDDLQLPTRPVLSDDRFGTLVHAIGLGRSTCSKVVSLVRCQATQLVALVLVFVSASILNGNGGVALTPFMVLFLSLVVAAGPAVMISLDPIGGAELPGPLPDGSIRLINRLAVSRWGLYGAAQGGAALIPLLFQWKVDAGSPGTTVAFVVMAFGTLLGGLAMRREPGSGIGSPVIQPLGILAVPALLTVFAVELQFLRELLGTTDLAGGEWFVGLALALVLPAVVEIDKAFCRPRPSTGSTNPGVVASSQRNRTQADGRPPRPMVGPKRTVRVEQKIEAEVANFASRTTSGGALSSRDGLALVAGPLVAATFFWARGASPVRYVPLLVLSVVLLGASLWFPSLIQRLVAAVRTGAERLGDVVLHLVAYLVMVLGVVPVHLLSRLVRYDPLETGWPSERSAFIRIDPARSRNPDGTMLDSSSAAARETPLAPSARRRSRARFGVVATILLAAVIVVVL